MSSLTSFLKLFKWDPKVDGSQKFNIPKALNGNWDKIDESMNNVQKTTQTTQVAEQIIVTDCAGANGKLDIKNGKTIQNGTPTLTAPIEIRNVGNTGSIDFKKANIKNYLDWNKFIKASNWINSESSGYKAFKIENLKPNTLYTLCRIDNIGFGKGTYAGFNSTNNNSNLFIHNTIQENNKQSISAISSVQGKLYITYYESIVLDNFIDIIKDCWIIEGNTFIKKQEQNIVFPLSEGQVLHEGDYLANDGIHQKKKTVILDETEIIEIVTYSNNKRFTVIPANFNPLYNNADTECLCNYFKADYTGTIIHPSNANQPCFFVHSSGILFTMTPDTNIKTIADFQAYLVEQKANGTPVKVEYELATEQVIPYTAEQKQAYYELQHLLMYEGYTNITCVNEIKPDIQLTYYYNNLLNNSYAKRLDELDKEIRQLQLGG